MVKLIIRSPVSPMDSLTFFCPHVDVEFNFLATFLATFLSTFLTTFLSIFWATFSVDIFAAFLPSFYQLVCRLSVDF